MGRYNREGANLFAQCPDLKSKFMWQASHTGKCKASGWGRAEKLAFCAILRRSFGLWLLPKGREN